MAAVSVSTPDRTSKSLVRTYNSIFGGRALTRVRSYPRMLLVRLVASPQKAALRDGDPSSFLS